MKREVNLYSFFIKPGLLVARCGQITGSEKNKLTGYGEEKGSTAFAYLLPGLSVHFAHSLTKSPKLYMQRS